MTWVSGGVRLRVPATSANLGPGFDALGLALALNDELVAEIAPSGLDLDVTGEGADLPRDERHLVVRAMRAGFDRLGGQPPGLRLRCDNVIPHGRGLGSSAAAIVAGLMLARSLVVDGTVALPDDDVLALAAELEGHPDNVAPCLLGGLTIAWSDGGRAAALRLQPDPAIRPVVFIPPFAASTQEARGLLPATVPHRDAAANAARAALLVAALTGAPEHLVPATADLLHQPYRAPAMPASADLVALLRGEGHAAVISGAGPTVLVLACSDAEVDALLGLVPAGWRVAGVDVQREPVQASGR
jgi:homoserine kinase